MGQWGSGSGGGGREGGVRERGRSEVRSSSVGTHRPWGHIVREGVLVVVGGLSSSMGTYCLLACIGCGWVLEFLDSYIGVFLRLYNTLVI